MNYQNFRGADLQEALSAVKATLGPNALIEGTRRVSNGRGGALGQQYVEVTSAPPQGLKWPFASREARAPEMPLRERTALMPPSAEQRSGFGGAVLWQQRWRRRLERRSPHWPARTTSPSIAATP